MIVRVGRGGRDRYCVAMGVLSSESESEFSESENGMARKAATFSSRVNMMSHTRVGDESLRVIGMSHRE